MLIAIRERFVGWLAWTILALIAVPFALWGIQDYLSPAARVTAAEVNGVEIPVPAFQERLQEYRRFLSRTLKENFDPDAMEPIMRERVINDLVGENLMQALVEAGGYRVSDAALAAEVQRNARFQKNGRFDPDQYRLALAENGLSPALFERQFRDETAKRLLPDALGHSVFVLPQEADRLQRLQQQTRSFAWHVLPAAPVRAAMQVSDDEIKGYYEQHPDKFKLPEMVVLEYVQLSLTAQAAQVPVVDAEILALYEQEKHLHITPERRQARHILIKAPKEGDLDAAAQQKLEQVQQRLKAGEDFGAVAKALSDDAGSAASGGDLGAQGKGVFDPDFEAALFSLSEGATSAPVRTQFGVHLIRLEKLFPGSERSLAELRPELEKKYREEKAQDKLYELSERLAELSYEHPDTLQPVADQLKLPINTTDAIPREGKAGLITRNPKVLQAAFSEPVLNGGRNSEPLDIGDGAWIVLRVKERLPPRQRTLDEVRAEVTAQLKADKADAKLKEEATAQAARLAAGEPRHAVAKGAAVQSLQDAPRTLSEGDATVRDFAFRMNKPKAGESSHAFLKLASGDYAVVSLSAVKDGAPDAGASAERDRVIADARKAEGERAARSVIEAERAAATVVIHKDRLQ
jgi:peptidyl-prolyl cis-trans isomerase D